MYDARPWLRLLREFVVGLPSGLRYQLMTSVSSEVTSLLTLVADLSSADAVAELDPTLLDLLSQTYPDQASWLALFGALLAILVTADAVHKPEYVI